MKEIIKIENLLNTNKAILEAQISINTNVHKLYISGEYWNSTLFSDFKSAILTIDTNKNVEYLKQLKNLSVEVLELYSKLERLPHDYKTIGGDTQMVLITREFDTPDIAIYKDYYNGEKWIWQMIMNNKHKVISKIVTDPNQYDKALHIKNDIILSDTKQIINILDSIQSTPESNENKKFADYLVCEEKDLIIDKIKKINRNTPSSIFIILIALVQDGKLLMNNNVSIYEAYFNEFGYKKDFGTLKRGLDYHDWYSVDKKYYEKIERMKNYLSN